MQGLGKQVLLKIENLLVQIDRKNVKKSDKQKKSSKQKEKHKKNVQPQTKIKDYYYKQSIEDDGKQNLCSSRIQQLYLNHFIRQKKLLDRNLTILEEQMRQIKNFKVQNKTSQFLNRKSSQKPIYERTNQILIKRQKSIEKIKLSAPKNQREIQQEEGLRIIQEKKKKYPKLTKQQFDQRMEQIQRRNLVRLQKIQRKKLEELEQKSSLYQQKPQINPVNQIWWQKKRLKKNLSSNVFERFSQYDMERKQKWEKYLQKRKKEETPFTPRISEATREIARKSHSRKSLIQNINRSHSCNALSRCQEQSRVERKQEPSISVQRSMSKSRTLKHGRSSTTMHSSRQALIERRNL